MYIQWRNKVDEQLVALLIHLGAPVFLELLPPLLIQNEVVAFDILGKVEEDDGEG